MMADAQMAVFDRRRVRHHRDRAAAGFDGFAFLFDHVADALKDRLLDVRRDFRRALDIGSRHGGLGEALTGHRGIETVFQIDLSPKMAGIAAATGRPTVVGDEEWLPFAPESMDLAVSALSLHWVNDLPGALVQINHALKPDGLFMGAMLGGDTLIELRETILRTEMDMLGGVSPRLSPLAEIRDAGGLLQRGGFALPVADAETVTVTYQNAFALFRDLRGMGETQAGLHANAAIPPRTFWPEVARRYTEQFAGSDGRIPATFQILYLTGWAPDESQPKPLQPGTASSRLADALRTTEIPAGDPLGPRPGMTE
ncbi:methyltransferase domain-containing protein [Fodinicurvata sp. EGI_FJ10296]|uniref:methyltransferase domain-containing protein n=1 Tax=Fodinicurvata sp. EGI_FJ10296 TaxID=3231908 RepID=UPI003455D479